MKRYMFFLLAAVGLHAWAAAQPVTIRGQIINKETGSPVASASIVVKESGKGTHADEFGQFTFSATALPVQLTITSIGYEPLEVEVKTSDALTVSLQSQSLL